MNKKSRELICIYALFYTVEEMGMLYSSLGAGIVIKYANWISNIDDI